MIVPAIKDTTPGTFKEFPKVLLDSLKRIFAQLPDSSVIIGELSIPNTTTKGNIRYKPKTNEFIADIPPLKVDTTITDTTSIIEKKETTTPEKFGYATIGIIVFVIIAIVVFLGFKFKWV